MNEEIEVWKDIEGYEGLYQVSNMGRIKSFVIGIVKILKSTPNDKGYIKVKLVNNRRRTCMPVHRIVAKSFIQNIENKPHVNHKNGIKTDNRVKNLEWVTISENKLHAISLGLVVMKKGEQHHKATLKNEDVIKIKELLNEKSDNELSKMFNVGINIIYNIRNKRSWKSIVLPKSLLPIC